MKRHLSKNDATSLKMSSYMTDEEANQHHSIIRSDNGEHHFKNPKSRILENSFSQQRFEANTPILTIGRVLPHFVLITIAYLVIGIFVLSHNNRVVEYHFSYTDCFDHQTNRSCDAIITEHNNNSIKIDHKCQCRNILEIDRIIPSPVFLYYRIGRMYQNYMQYSSSIDEMQMIGHLKGSSDLCGKNLTYGQDGKPILPCGMIANSFFNDTFQLLLLEPSSIITTNVQKFPVPMKQSDMTWTPLHDVWNPPISSACAHTDDPVKCSYNGTVKPPNWNQSIWQLDPHDPGNNGFHNQQLLSWLRPAAFADFRKMIAKVDHDSRTYNRTFEKGLPAGRYLLIIDYSM
ncbi:hypothetical protein RDWZM_001959 [Blomia tropicalis]|uniref:Uncharacterized protein n=1 Tax=Blomia tropicalis TaxID=40697 RepID=A0A9Q0MDE9_BLOTA|nr:hypothetical protein RDWZM_001959 [Blomia tropicalis]